MAVPLKINDRLVGPGHPTYIVAEMSANHGHDINEAKRLFDAAKEAGADAIKLQTYTPDTLTIDCDRPDFLLGEGTIWAGRKLYDLYGEAYTPWDWHAELKEHANQLGMDLFSTPFDATAVDFLMDLDIPVYKVASFENADIPLLRKIASTGKPVIMSTGMADLGTVEYSVRTLREHGCEQLALLKCTSAYPAPVEEANLHTIPHLAQTFDVVAGLSDHTMGSTVPVAAVALGACIIEKHFIRDRSVGGPDASFSMTPDEFKEMVDSVRIVERALGRVSYDLTPKQVASKVFRRSLYIVEDVRAGEVVTLENVRVIRPGYGLEPRYYDEVIGKRFSEDLPRGTALSWDLLSAPERAD